MCGNLFKCDLCVFLVSAGVCGVKGRRCSFFLPVLVRKVKLRWRKWLL